MEARRVVHNCVKKLFVDIFYEARILAVITFHKKILKTDIDRPTACRTYLTKAEYMKVSSLEQENVIRCLAFEHISD